MDASLILLDPIGCEVLKVKNPGRVKVRAHDGNSGVIWVDSNGSKCGDSRVIELADNAVLAAEGPDGKIWANALNFRSPSQVYSGNPTPKPEAPSKEPPGRAPMDKAYGEAIAGLRSEYGTKVGVKPPGFRRWTTEIESTASGFPSGGDACSIDGSYDISVPAGNWYVDCEDGLELKKATVVFRGGNVVMDAGLELENQSAVAFNCPSGSISRSNGTSSQNAFGQCGAVSDDSVIVVRSGSVFEIENSGYIALPRTFVYATDDDDDDVFELENKSALFWTAPTGGPFANLAFWTESSEELEFENSSSIEVEGIFFAPNVQMEMENSSSFSGGAQVFLRSLVVENSAQFEVWPVPDRAELPGGGDPGKPSVQLIR